MQCLAKLSVFLLVVGVVLCADRRWCNTQKDCHSSECCVSNNPPRGKRILTDNHIGHCVRLGHVGDSCYVKYGSSATPLTEVTYGCPCHSPLTCHGSHFIEVPLGEPGKCGL